MMVAQRLYEAGRITYMRTDSVNLSSLAINTAKTEIEKHYGSEYSQVRKYHTNSKGAQEAHEAIRPTDMSAHSIDGTSQEKTSLRPYLEAHSSIANGRCKNRQNYCCY